MMLLPPRILLVSLITATLISVSACKARRGSRLQDSGELNTILGPCDASGVAAVVTPVRGFKSKLPADQVEFYRAKYLSIADATNWQKYQILDGTALEGGGQSIVINEFNARLTVAAPAATPVALDLIMNQDDVLGAPLQVKNLLAQVAAGFLKGFVVQGWQASGGLGLAVNLFSSYGPADALAPANSVLQGNGPADALAPANSVLQGKGDVLSEVLGLDADSRIGMPLYTIPINIQNQRILKSQQILPGDVFSVTYEGEAIGSGFGIWLGDTPLPVSSEFNVNVFPFARLSRESLRTAQTLATNTQDVGAKILDASASLTQSKNLNVQLKDKKLDGEIEVLGYRLSRNMISGSVKVVDLNQGQMANYFTLRNSGCKTSLLAGAQDREAATLSQLLKQSFEQETRTGEIRHKLDEFQGLVSGNYRAMVHKDFLVLNEIWNQISGDPAKIDFLKPVLYSRAGMYLSNNLFRLQSDRFTESQRSDLLALAKQADELEEMSKTIAALTSKVFGYFDYVGMRRKFDTAPGEPLLYRLQGVKHSTEGSLYGADIGFNFHALFAFVGDTYKSNAQVSILKWQNGLIWSSQVVDKRLGDWFTYEPYTLILKELTGENPPLLKWKSLATSREAFNADPASLSKIHDYLKRHYGRIYFGLDSLGLEYGENVVPFKSDGSSRVASQDLVNKGLRELVTAVHARAAKHQDWHQKLVQFQQAAFKNKK